MSPSNQFNIFFKDDKFLYLKANNFFFPLILDGFFQNSFLKIFEKKNQVSLRSFFSFLDLKKGFFLDSSRFFFPKSFPKIKSNLRVHLKFLSKSLEGSLDLIKKYRIGTGGYRKKYGKKHRKKHVEKNIGEKVIQERKEETIAKMFFKGSLNSYMKYSSLYGKFVLVPSIDFFLNYFYKNLSFQSSGFLLKLRFFKDLLQTFELKKSMTPFFSFIKFF